MTFCRLLIIEPPSIGIEQPFQLFIYCMRTLLMMINQLRYVIFFSEDWTTPFGGGLALAPILVLGSPSRDVSRKARAGQLLILHF